MILNMSFKASYLEMLRFSKGPEFDHLNKKSKPSFMSNLYETENEVVKKVHLKKIFIHLKKVPKY